MTDFRSQPSQDTPPNTPTSQRVLTGPADRVTGDSIRLRTVRLGHLGPDVKQELETGGFETSTTSNGESFKNSEVQVCTERLVLSGGTANWTFPDAFAFDPAVTAIAHSTNAMFVTISSLSETGVTVHAWDNTGASQNPDVTVVATGHPAEEA